MWRTECFPTEEEKIRFFYAGPKSNSQGSKSRTVENKLNGRFKVWFFYKGFAVLPKGCQPGGTTLYMGATWCPCQVIPPEPACYGLQDWLLHHRFPVVGVVEYLIGRASEDVTFWSLRSGFEFQLCHWLGDLERVTCPPLILHLTLTLKWQIIPLRAMERILRKCFVNWE